jgi:death-on-curing protein
LPTSDSDPHRPVVTLEQLVYLHTVAIIEFGGREGMRDPGLLKAALARPLAGFGGKNLYTTPFARAAALFEGLIRNHGFVDGNKRVAVLAAAFWLEREGHTLTATQDNLVQVTLAVVEHRLSLDALASWLKANSAPL